MYPYSSWCKWSGVHDRFDVDEDCQHRTGFLSLSSFSCWSKGKWREKLVLGGATENDEKNWFGLMWNSFTNQTRNEIWFAMLVAMKILTLIIYKAIEQNLPPVLWHSTMAVTKPNMGEIWWLTPQSCSKTIIKQCWKIIKKCIRKIRRQSIAMQLQMIANNHKHFFMPWDLFFFFFCWCPFHSFFMAFYFFMAICLCLFLLPHFFFLKKNSFWLLF